MIYYSRLDLYILDIDECLSGNGGCNDTCENTYGSFSCNCHTGFIYSEDETCEGKSLQIAEL